MPLSNLAHGATEVASKNTVRVGTASTAHNADDATEGHAGDAPHGVPPPAAPYPTSRCVQGLSGGPRH